MLEMQIFFKVFAKTVVKGQVSGLPFLSGAYNPVSNNQSNIFIYKEHASYSPLVKLG